MADATNPTTQQASRRARIALTSGPLVLALAATVMCILTITVFCQQQAAAYGSAATWAAIAAAFVGTTVAIVGHLHSRDALALASQTAENAELDRLRDRKIVRRDALTDKVVAFLAAVAKTDPMIARARADFADREALQLCLADITQHYYDLIEPSYTAAHIAAQAAHEKYLVDDLATVRDYAVAIAKRATQSPQSFTSNDQGRNAVDQQEAIKLARKITGDLVDYNQMDVDSISSGKAVPLP